MPQALASAGTAISHFRSLQKSACPSAELDRPGQQGSFHPKDTTMHQARTKLLVKLLKNCHEVL